MAMSPAQVSAKWAKQLGQATESIKAGVNNVTVAPGELAARKQQEYIAGVLDKADKWAANVKAVKLEDWRNATLTTGIARLQTGTTKGQPKMERFMAQWLPYEEGLKSKLRSMPKGSIEASIARATEAIRYNAAFRRNP